MLPVQLTVVAPQLFDFLLQVVEFLGIDGASLGRQDGGIGGIRLSFKPSLDLILELFESKLFAFDFHFHGELLFLHVDILFGHFFDLFLELGNDCFLLFNHPVQPSPLSVVFGRPLSVVLRIRQLLLQLLHCLLVLLEAQHLVI